MKDQDEFYVGYLPQSPAGLARFTRGRVLIALAIAAGAALVAAAAQSPFARAHFEYGQDMRTFEGWISTDPYPSLLVPIPGVEPGEPGAVSRFLLGVFGKAGAGEVTRGLDGERVRAQGTLVYRDDRVMLELADGGLEVLGEMGEPALASGELGVQTLVGEIVDSKCFLGVMKPGNLKPHRACATRCIAGGIPPVFLVRDEEGRAAYFLLVDEQGGAVNDRVLDRVAEPLEITGRVRRHDDLLVLEADPDTYRRL